MQKNEFDIGVNNVIFSTMSIYTLSETQNSVSVITDVINILKRNFYELLQTFEKTCLKLLQTAKGIY